MFPPRFLKINQHRTYGCLLYTSLYGYRYALQCGADYIFQTDSDGQTLASEFPAFWRRRRQYSIQIGNRNHRQDGLSRIFVTKTLRLVLRLIFHLDIPDANTPYRLMSRQALARYINKVPENFNLSNVMPVSYTHLDVYKRQLLYS